NSIPAIVPGVQSRLGRTSIAATERHENSNIKASPNAPACAACSRYALANNEAEAATKPMARTCRRTTADTRAANQGAATAMTLRTNPGASINRLPGWQAAGGKARRLDAGGQGVPFPAGPALRTTARAASGDKPENDRELCRDGRDRAPTGRATTEPAPATTPPDACLRARVRRQWPSASEDNREAWKAHAGTATYAPS